MKGLTSRQKEVFGYVKCYLKENVYWPSIREIQKEFKFKSTNAVMGHLRALEHKGIVKRQPVQARAFKVEGGGSERVDTNDSMITLSIYGTMPVGYPAQG